MNPQLLLRRSAHRAHPARRGLAILLVLMVLLALLILVGPFLWTAGEADAAGARLTDQSTLRLALDDAGRHVRSQLVGSHASVDPSRASDGLEELAVSIGLDPGFYNHADDGGVMWDHEVTDLAGRVDLTTASPQLIANLMGRASYLSRALPSDADELRLANADGFPEAGLLWIGGELIEYRLREGTAFKELDRGVLGGPGCGPRPRTSHAAGAPVISLDAWAVAWWRASRKLRPAAGASVDDLVSEIRSFLPTPMPGATISADEMDDPEAWSAAIEEGLAEALGQVQREDPFQAFASVLDRYTTLFGGVAAEDLWSRPVRLINDVVGCTLQVEQWRYFNAGSTVLLEGPEGSEVHLVRSANNGTIQLENEVQGNYRGLEAHVRVLARRPVNINTAPPEVLRALVQNVGLVGRNERISRQEAEALAAEMVAKRPFDHMEDFLRRLVAPAAGITVAGADESIEQAAQRSADLGAAAPVISIEDAVALYRNALNANDQALRFSTAPFSFVTRDVYELDLRAQLHAPSGVPRNRARRRQIEWIAPPGDLLQVVATQADFDEALRLRRNAPGYRTTPERTHIDDVTRMAAPPSRITAHMPLTADRHGARRADPRAGDRPARRSHAALRQLDQRPGGLQLGRRAAPVGSRGQPRAVAGERLPASVQLRRVAQALDQPGHDLRHRVRRPGRPRAPLDGRGRTDPARLRRTGRPPRHGLRGGRPDRAAADRAHASGPLEPRGGRRARQPARSDGSARGRLRLRR
jgi:hypothetical protein